MTRDRRRAGQARWIGTGASLVAWLVLGAAHASASGTLPDDDMSTTHRLLVLGGGLLLCALALLGLGVGIFQLRKQLRRRRRAHYRGYPGHPDSDPGRSPH